MGRDEQEEQRTCWDCKHLKVCMSTKSGIVEVCEINNCVVYPNSFYNCCDYVKKDEAE